MKVWNQEKELWTGGKLLQRTTACVLGLILGGRDRWNSGEWMWNEKAMASAEDGRRREWWSAEEEEEGNGLKKEMTENVSCGVKWNGTELPSPLIFYLISDTLQWQNSSPIYSNLEPPSSCWWPFERFPPRWRLLQQPRTAPNGLNGLQFTAIAIEDSSFLLLPETS